jgi:hypothetical protein
MRFCISHFRRAEVAPFVRAWVFVREPLGEACWAKPVGALCERTTPRGIMDISRADGTRADGTRADGTRADGTRADGTRAARGRGSTGCVAEENVKKTGHVSCVTLRCVTSRRGTAHCGASRHGTLRQRFCGSGSAALVGVTFLLLFRRWHRTAPAR